MKRFLNFGITGGVIAHDDQPGSFFGKCGIQAAEFNRKARLSCGAFSRRPDASRATAEHYKLAPEFGYPSLEALLESEKALPLGQRMDFLYVCSTNNVHCGQTLAALKAGFPVISEKPIGMSLSEALEIRAMVKKTRLPFAVAHTYRGYPMVVQAGEMIKWGNIGDIIDVQFNYTQDWLKQALEQDLSATKQAWRAQASIGGPGGVLADIGIHAFDLLRSVTGLEVTKLSALVKKVVPEREVPDHVRIILELSNGASGGIFTSQVTSGHENDISFVIHGTKGSLKWSIRDCNTLWFIRDGEPWKEYRTSTPYLTDPARSASRLPPGHPEGNEGALANVFDAFISQVDDYICGQLVKPMSVLATDDDAVLSMAFIDACLRSQEEGLSWVILPDIASLSTAY